MSFSLALLLASAVLAVKPHAADGTSALTTDDLHELISFEDAASAGHVERLRDEESLNTLVYANEDNTKTIYFYSENIKYIDKNGKTVDKTNELTQTGDGYISKNNDIITVLPKHISSGASVSYGDISIRITPAFAINNASYQSVIDAIPSVFSNAERGFADSVTYAEAFGAGTRLTYHPMYSGISSNIVIPQYDGTSTFDFLIETGDLFIVDSVGTSDGDISDVETSSSIVDRMLGYDRLYFVRPDDAGTPVARVSGVTVSDSTGNTVPGALRFSRLKNGTYTVTAVVPEAFLKSPGTVYPVTVSPNYEIVLPEFGPTEGMFRDTMLSASAPDKNFGIQPTMSIGGTDKGYLLISFVEMASKNLDLLWNISDSNNTRKAVLSLYCTKKGTGSTYAYSAEANPKIKNWAEGTPTYNNCGVSCFDVKGRNCTLTENAKCDFDITNIFNDWFSESPKGDFKDGLLIKIYDKYFGNTSYGYTFATTENSVDTYKPSLSITVAKDPLVRIKNSSSTESEPAYLQVSGSSANSGVGITLHKYSNGDSVNDCASGEIFRLTYNDSKSCYSFYPICSSYGYGTAICATFSGKQATTGTSGNKEWAVHLSSRSADGVNRYSIRETEKTLYLTCSSISDGASVTAGTYEVYGKCYWEIEKVYESGEIDIGSKVKYFYQEDPSFCSTACIRMVLGTFLPSDKVPTETVLQKEQETLAKDNKENPEEKDAWTKVYILRDIINKYFRLNNIDKYYCYNTEKMATHLTR